jgi:hypothetical protein
MEPDDLLCSRNARPQKGGREWPGALLARRTRTIGMCSFDARSKGQPWPLSYREMGKELEGPGLMARPGKSIAMQSEG